MAAGMLIGVDVGGTFTDAVVISGSRTWRAKAPSTYPEVGRGVLAACRLAAEACGLPLEELLPQVQRFGLGTTAVTNVIATRRGLRVGLLTTRGFEEMLRLARARVTEEDGWLAHLPSLLVEGGVIGIKERIDRNGEVITPIDPDAVREAGRRLKDELAVDAIAVSFLWSFINPSHEELAIQVLREALPGTIITGAAALRPVIREYERTTLAVLNAYSFGAFSGIGALADELAQAGLNVPVLLSHSGGGTISIGQAREQPVWLAESGPAAGVTAAAVLAAMSGETKALTCDLGGTSWDVSHIDGGSPARVQRGDLMGIWTALPRVDVESIGAGGGSIAWVDARQMLRVGPHSAGSSPGPACYGRGGTEPTLTDALLVLGYIDAERFLGGRMKLDLAASVAACARVGAALGYGPEETAWGIREIALAEMAKATRARLAIHALSAIEHPIVSYGGCGSLFTCEVAKSIGAPRVLVGELASVLSAFGAATMDVRRERVRSMLHHLPLKTSILDEVFTELRAAVLQDLAADGVPEADRSAIFEADTRFAGQRWEVSLALPELLPASDGGAEIARLFRQEYIRRYGPAATGAAGTVELVALRAIGIGKIGAPELLRAGSRPAKLRPARPTGSRAVRLDRRGPPSPVEMFDGVILVPGDEIFGPALVDGADTTTWIPAGSRAHVDNNRTIIMEVAA